MSSQADPSETAMPRLILFTTGDAPRSRRARDNLSAALSSRGLESIEPMEIDLLKQPEQTLTYSVFATPALLRTDESGDMEVLYGDLSDERKLADFLDELRDQ